MKLFHNQDAKQNLSSTSWCLLSVFMSNRTNLIISMNLFLERVLLNIGHSQDVFHRLEQGRPLCPNTPLVIIRPINLSSSRSVIFQLTSPVTRWASEIVHFWIFRSIASLNIIRKEEDGLPSITWFVANAVGPGLTFTTICCCKRSPLCTWKVDNFRHEDPSFPMKSCTPSSFPSKSVTASLSVSSSLDSVTMGSSSLSTANGGASFCKGSSLSPSSPSEQSDSVSCKRPGEPSTFSPYLQSTYVFAVQYAFPYPLHQQQTKSE